MTSWLLFPANYLPVNSSGWSSPARLMNQPEVLLADEPTSNLDEKTELEIMELFHELHANLKITLVMVTHTRQLISYGTRAVEMSEGKIVNGNH